MSSPASIRRHPIHPMLVVFPIGLWIFSLICDLIYQAGAHNAFWKGVAFYTMLVGVIGALLAAVPGFIDSSGYHAEGSRPVGASPANFTVVVALIEYFPAAAETLIKACVPARLAGTSTRTEALSVNVSAATAKAVASSAALDAGKTRPPDAAPIWCCTF